MKMIGCYWSAGSHTATGSATDPDKGINTKRSIFILSSYNIMTQNVSAGHFFCFCFCCILLLSIN